VETVLSGYTPVDLSIVFDLVVMIGPLIEQRNYKDVLRLLNSPSNSTKAESIDIYRNHTKTINIVFTILYIETNNSSITPSL
jgi:hypothetical protein